MTTKAAGENPVDCNVRPLPAPDLTMPSAVPDGSGGAHYYRASTVQALLSAERERWLQSCHDILAATDLQMRDGDLAREIADKFLEA